MRRIAMVLIVSATWTAHGYSGPNGNLDAPHRAEERMPGAQSAPKSNCEYVSHAGANGIEETERKVQFYLSKLKDRTCTGTYGHGYTWYTAAEELGRIGSAAIPGLIEKLTTRNDYEMSLALYALMLASQDPAVLANTGGEYVKLTIVLSERNNRENKEIALAWWQKHKHHFQ